MNTKLDFQLAKATHLHYKNGLRSLLYENKEDDALSTYHYNCPLGKWLYEHALTVYGTIPEIHELEKAHTELHSNSRELVKIFKEGKVDQARTGLQEIEKTADQLVDFMHQVEQKIQLAEVPTKVRRHKKDVQENIKLLNELLNRNELLDKRIKDKASDLLNEHQSLYDFFMQAPGLFCVLKGPAHVFELVNPSYKQIIGNKNLIGKPIRKAMPELDGQGIYELLDKVYLRKRPFVGKEILVFFDRGKGEPEEAYINFIYKPIVNSDGETTGILVFGYDVTEQINSRKRSEESETRLKLAIEAAEMGSFDWNMNTQEFIYSDRLADIYGFSKKKKITHKNFVESIHPEDKPIRINAIEESLKSGVLYYEARILLPNSGMRWVKFNGKIIFDRKHNPMRMYGTVLDITNQKTQEESLEKKVKERTKELIAKNELLVQQKEFVDTILNASEDNIAVFDTELRYVSLNKQAMNSYKKRAEKIIGQKIHELFPQVKDSGMWNDLKRALKGETIHNYNYRSPILKGYFENIYIPLKDRDDKVYGVLLIAHDNTAIVEASEKLISANIILEEKNADLERSNRELESFSYIASHDLQEPLRKIQTFSGLIKKNLKGDGPSEEYIDKIILSSQRMSDLIKAVLNYSRLSKNEDKFEKIDLNKILENVKSDFELLIKEKNAIIKHEPLLSIKGSPLQMSQLFTNLISNSLKFSNKRPIVSITTKMISTEDVKKKSNFPHLGNYMELIFKDNGIGFDQKYVDQVFTMFKRLHGTQAYEGAGIGLALVKKIVENHHGHIFVKSEIGKGTTFYIYIPVLQK